MAEYPVDANEAFRDDITLEDLLAKLAAKRNEFGKNPPEEYKPTDFTKPPQAFQMPGTTFPGSEPAPGEPDPTTLDWENAGLTNVGEPNESRTGKFMRNAQNPVLPYTIPGAAPPAPPGEEEYAPEVTPPAPSVTNAPQGIQGPEIEVQTPVPPPTPSQPSASPYTGQPGAFPAPPGGQPAPGSPEATKRDPNDILRQAYAPAIKQAMEAREKDLARQTGFMAGGLGRELLMQGGNLQDAGLTAAGAGILKRQATDPLYVKSLEDASKASQELSKAQLESMKMDPDSEISEGARLAFYSTPTFNEAARKLAESSGGKLSEVDARTEIFQKTRKLSSVGMAAYTEMALSGAKFDTERSAAAANYATEKERLAQTAQINLETSNKKTLYAAWNNPASAVSRTTRAQVKGLLTPQQLAEVPNFDSMTAHEIATQFPDIMRLNAEIMKWQQEYNINLAKDTAVDNKEWTVRTETVEGPAPGFPGKKVPNSIGVATRERFLMQNSSAKIAMDNADQLFRSISGPENAVEIGLQTTDGQRIYRQLLAFANHAKQLSPQGAGAQLYESLTSMNPEGTFIPSQFIFGSKGKKGSVEAALREMNVNHLQASKPFFNEQVEAKGIPPDYPPTFLPMEITSDTMGGKTVRTYTFDINGKKWTYWRNPKGYWNKKERTE
jgi:hypothetical protein